MNKDFLTDQAVLETVGERLARSRIDAGLTQAELARQAGIGRATVERLEAGRSAQMSSLIRVLRVLDLLDDFLRALPESVPGPMDLLQNRPSPRQRASSPRKNEREQEQWRWGDES